MNTPAVLGTQVHDASPEYHYPKVPSTTALHPGSLALIEYWRSCESTGGMRMGRDIPHRAIARLLYNITICEPVDDWKDGRIRLAGGVLTERFGHNVQGMLVSELYKNDPEGGRILMECGRGAEKSRQPCMLLTRVAMGQVEVMRFEVVALPLLAPDGIAHWGLAGIFRF